MSTFEQRIAAIKSADSQRQAAENASNQRRSRLLGPGLKSEELFPKDLEVIQGFLGFMASKGNPSPDATSPVPGYLVGRVIPDNLPDGYAYGYNPPTNDFAARERFTIRSGEDYYDTNPGARRLTTIPYIGYKLLLGIDNMFRGVWYGTANNDLHKAYSYTVPQTGGFISGTLSNVEAGGTDSPAKPPEHITYLRLLDLEELLPCIAIAKT